ncbi:MAG: hypothetical protein IKF17_04410 [Clostridia bacterium]|nr:hypothetical protein [Clostridia bacterium]
MNTLANGLGRASKELILGADEEILEGVRDYFAQKGQKVVFVYEDDCLKEDCDVVIYQIDWEKASVYLSPFKADDYCPNVVIALNCLSAEQVIDQICGFLEAINF